MALRLSRHIDAIETDDGALKVHAHHSGDVRHFGQCVSQQRRFIATPGADTKGAITLQCPVAEGDDFQSARLRFGSRNRIDWVLFECTLVPLAKPECAHFACPGALLSWATRYAACSICPGNGGSTLRELREGGLGDSLANRGIVEIRRFPPGVAVSQDSIMR
jgi:hypothetical protein